MLVICKKQTKELTKDKMYACVKCKDGFVIISDRDEIKIYPIEYFTEVRTYDIIR